MMPDECRRKLGRCPNGAGLPPIAACRTMTHLVDQHNYLGAAREAPRILSSFVTHGGSHHKLPVRAEPHKPIANEPGDRVTVQIEERLKQGGH